VEENQINPIPFGSYAQALLSSDERKIVAQFQKELLKAPDECVFEFRFRILVLQIQELEDERISHVRVGQEGLLLGGDGSCATGPLIGTSGDLAIELPDRPAALQCLPLVILSGLGVRDGEQADVV